MSDRKVSYKLLEWSRLQVKQKVSIKKIGDFLNGLSILAGVVFLD